MNPRSLVYQGRKHYFIIEFAQKPGQLRQFVDDALARAEDAALLEVAQRGGAHRGLDLAALARALGHGGSL